MQFNRCCPSADRVVDILRGTGKQSETDLVKHSRSSTYFDMPDNHTDELFDNLAAHRARVSIWQRFSRRLKEGADCRFLHLCDLHVPFCDVAVLDEALHHALSSDIPYCVINGDFLDVYAASKFAKSKSVEIRRELQMANHILGVLSEHFEEIILIEGNHERRIRRYVAGSIDTELQWLFRVDLLEVLAAEFDNVVYAGGSWCKIGSVVFAHPDTYSKIPGRTVLSIANSLRERGEELSGVIVGHTHKVVSGTIANGMALYEAGCACHEMDYVAVGRKPISPWTCGYGVIVLDDRGGIDVNSTRIHVASSQPITTIS